LGMGEQASIARKPPANKRYVGGAAEVESARHL
jgi:hypothetical protein